ncbi:hypothetical protein [Streptomyces sp. NPDC020141]|uniref:TRADD-N-associated membrane domain-containing protein n=1 Tax=Streptomyces sp. NPDC020141 TaxID=3365065 RepID=UPI0037AA1E57
MTTGEKRPAEAAGGKGVGRPTGPTENHGFRIGEVSGSAISLGNHNTVVIAGDSGPVKPPEQAREPRGESLAEQRQRFFFDFLKHSLRQAEWTFRLSVWFMSGGAGIILAAAVLGLVHAGNPDLSYLPIVTFLTGALITGGGGALALHARRARAHVTEQADRMDIKIDQDHRMEKATAFIDRVDDPAARDRLNSAAALEALGMRPSAEAVADRTLPGREGRGPGEIESGGLGR